MSGSPDHRDSIDLHPARLLISTLSNEKSLQQVAIIGQNLAFSMKRLEPAITRQSLTSSNKRLEPGTLASVAIETR